MKCEYVHVEFVRRGKVVLAVGTSEHDFGFSPFNGLSRVVIEEEVGAHVHRATVQRVKVFEAKVACQIIVTVFVSDVMISLTRRLEMTRT